MLAATASQIPCVLKYLLALVGEQIETQAKKRSSRDHAVLMLDLSEVEKILMTIQNFTFCLLRNEATDEDSLKIVKPELRFLLQNPGVCLISSQCQV